jgi:hypothetical protein
MIDLKHLVLIILGLITIETKAQQTFSPVNNIKPIYKPDTIYRYSNSNGVMKCTGRTSYSYDVRGRISSMEAGSYSLGSYKPSSRVLFNYTNSDVPTYIIEHYYNQNLWKIRTIIQRSTNSLGEIISEKYVADIGQ